MTLEELRARLRVAQDCLPGGELSFHLWPDDIHPYRVVRWTRPAWGATENKTVAAGETMDACMAALNRHVSQHAPTPAIAAE